MSKSRLHFVAWRIKQRITFWNPLKGRQDEALIPSLDWGLVLENRPAVCVTRRLRDGMKWCVQSEDIVETKEVTNSRELMEIEKDYPNWVETFEKARADEKEEEQKKLMKQKKGKAKKEKRK